jgi:nicotinamidase-related amidase
MEGTWGAEICEECAPLPGEPVVTKHRSSAFTGTNLDMILRSNGVQTVVVIGEQTPGCIEATYRDASYHDYYNVLVEDLVAAYRQDLHEASLLIQKARHDVCTSAEVLDIWQRARSIEPANHELALSE